MKIGFISDTHEQVEQIKKVVTFFNRRNVEEVIHLGDICSPIMANYFMNLKHPLKIIFGNNDGDHDFLRKKFNFAKFYDTPSELKFKGFKILCMHQPNFLEVFAKSGEYKLIAYGHTHKIDKRHINETLILNPGEVANLLSSKSTAAIYDSEKNDASIYEIV
jgi:putative phosphoesterase